MSNVRVLHQGEAGTPCQCVIKEKEYVVHAGQHHYTTDQPTQDDSDWMTHAPFHWDAGIKEGRYILECFCNQVQFSIFSDPVDVKICHCDMCKKLHGAPMQSAAIFHKTDVRLTKGGLGDVAFFSPSLADAHMTCNPTPCPRKIYCTRCGSPLADQGRNMFLAYPSSLHPNPNKHFGSPSQERSAGKLPPEFNIQKHIFYGRRAFEMWDDVEKWEGLDGKSRRMRDDGSIIEDYEAIH